MLKTVSSITNAIGALNYKGTWNANTNTPTIVSGTGVKGDYYVVSVDGSTAIDGISNWGVGDWITFNGSVWQRVEGGADLNGVNLKFTGTLTGDTGIVNIGSGQFYKDASGKVGVGTSSPTRPLSINGNGFITRNNSFEFDVSNVEFADIVWRVASGYTKDSAAIRPVGGVSFARWGLGFFTNNSSDTTTAAVERVRIARDGAVYFPSVGTTASAANAFLDSSATPENQLLRSTSSIRYKTDIETLDSERANNFILNARPVWYRSLAEADRKEWGWYGLIAEEVAKIEPCLVHWSYTESDYEEVVVEVEDFNEDGEANKKTHTERQLKAGVELKPDGVQYDRLTVILLDVVKRQQQEINALKARFDAANL